MLKAALLSFPHKAVVRGADAEPASGPMTGNMSGFGPAGAQIEAPHAIGDGRSERLVDHDRPASFRVLDGEDRATWQQADRQPEAIDDPRGVEIRLGAASPGSLMANAAWLSFDRFDLVLNIRRATVTGGYDTVFEFDMNFKRTVKIRSPKSGSGRTSPRAASLPKR